MPISEDRVRELFRGEEVDYASAVAEVGVEGLAVLASMIQSADATLAAQAACLVAEIAVDPAMAPATLPLLAIAAAHEDSGVRAAAAYGASRVGDAALTLIEGLLSDEDAGVRLIAFRGLAPPLPPSVLAAVQDVAAGDTEPSVRDKAAGLVARNPESTLANELLAGILEYAHTRLTELRAAALASVGLFATAVGAPDFVDTGGAVAGHLTTARAALDLVPARIEADDFAGAALHLGSALRAVGDAAELVPGASLLANLLGSQIPWDSVAPGGLVRQLGLTEMVPGLTVTDDGGTLIYSISTQGRTLTPAPAKLAFERAELTARLRLDGGEPSLSVALALKGIEVGVGGGPIASLLGGAGGSAHSDIVLGVDTARGLTVGGGSGARAVLPARPKIGALDLREMVLELPQGMPGMIDIGSTIAVRIGGVIKATLDGSGLRLHIDPARAISGDDPLSVSPKPPTGIGLAIDTGLIRGGGFLAQRAGGYGGALQLRLGPVEVKAVGLLTLEPGFALVVVMSIGFVPPIDLSFGFTLNAVGGVVGIEHRLDVDALRAAFSSGGLDHILFPPDPVAAAPAILTTLEHVFPVDPGSVVIGPMIEIGWGRPVSFVTAQLGVIVSLPDPKIVIIGRGRVALPAPQLPIVDLRLTVFGEVGPDHLLIFGSLNGSRIAIFPVSGDIGLLLRWGGAAEFAFSAGGFHPRYSPPPELTGMRRLAMNLSPPAILTLRAESYFALTSNSVQFGALVELGADLGVASISGHFGFDALIIFAPRFAFVVEVDIGLTVRALGVTLLGVQINLLVEGPAPWRAEGRAEVEILWTSVPIDVGPFTWGDSDNPPPALADPLRLAHAALHRSPGAWQALEPPDADRVVRLKTAQPSEVDVTVHPMGLFDVRQHAIPLETVITRVGANPVPEGRGRVHLGVPLVNGTEAGALSEVTDLFSAGTYLDLSEDQKLSRPGFEPMPAGVRIRPPGEMVDSGRAREVELRYETFVCDEDGVRGRHSTAAWDLLVASSATFCLAAGSAGRTELRARTRYDTEPDPIMLAGASEVIAVSKVTVTAAAPEEWATYTHAAEAPLAVDTQLARLGVA